MGGNDSRGGPGGRGGRGPRSDSPRSRGGAGHGGRGPGNSGRGGAAGRQDAGSPEAPIKRSLSGKAPPRRSSGAPTNAAEARPSLPSQRPELPAAVYREIKRTSRAQDVNDVANAVGSAAEAVDAGDLQRARELLDWAKGRATRSVSIREGLGVACYLMGDFEAAQRELQAYRRMSGRADQNHLLADAARALGRTERVVELVDEMIQAHAEGDVPLDRAVEAVIVHAGMLADAGRPADALVVLERAPLTEGGVSVPHGRAWYAAGNIAEEMGDLDAARGYFESAMLVEDDFLDAESRVNALPE